MNWTGTESMLRIYDCFTFFNENDLLALRLEELNNVTTAHILVHAGQTFRGTSKPDYLDYERFQPWIDAGKLRVYWIPKFPRFMDTWGREEYQRNEIELALENSRVSGEDFVILSDIDEIPRRQAVVDARLCDIARFRMHKYTYAINMLTDEGNTAAKIFRYEMLQDHTPQQIRKHPTEQIIENGGWEFSSLGDPEHVYKKLTSFAHDEFDWMITPDYVRQKMNAGKDLLGRNIEHTVVEIDDTYPEAIKRNREYWRKYEWSALD